MKKPEIDTYTFARELEGAVGKEQMNELRRLPLDTKETLRFFSESLHVKNGSLQRNANTLLSILRRDRLQAELQTATEAMREAEAKGDEAAVDKLAEEARTLTSVIAKMTE